MIVQNSPPIKWVYYDIRMLQRDVPPPPPLGTHRGEPGHPCTIQMFVYIFTTDDH